MHLYTHTHKKKKDHITSTIEKDHFVSKCTTVDFRLLEVQRSLGGEYHHTPLVRCVPAVHVYMLTPFTLYISESHSLSPLPNFLNAAGKIKVVLLPLVFCVKV